MALSTGRWSRADWIGLFGRAPTAALAAAWDTLELSPAYTLVRPPEAGMVMVRGRAGGTGAPFNLGEMTVTRCVVALDVTSPGTHAAEPAAPIHGFAYVAGRREHHALRAALMDGLLQSGTGRDAIERDVLDVLAAGETAERAARARDVAATKVDFFTMVRSES
ncbi:MAG: phosphonate C-P lyase system protein PhnG [Pseudomonadota bacterium]